MNNVVNIKDYKEENTPHEVAEVICLHCMNRWISVHEQGEWLAAWEYIGVFTRPWTEMVTTVNEKGVRFHNWPEENKDGY